MMDLSEYTTSTYDLTLTSQSDNNTYGLSYEVDFLTTRSRTFSTSTSYNASVFLDSRSFSTDVTETFTTEYITTTLTETLEPLNYRIDSDTVESYDTYPGDGMDLVTITDTASQLNVETVRTLTYEVIPDGNSWYFDLRYSGTTSRTSYTYSSYYRTDTEVTSTVSTEQAYSGPREDQSVEYVVVDESITCTMSETSSLSTQSFDTLSLIYTGVQWSDVSSTSKATTYYGTGSKFSIRTFISTKSTTSWSRTYEVNRVAENSYETSTTSSAEMGATVTWRFQEFHSRTYYTEWGHDDNKFGTKTRTWTDWTTVVNASSTHQQSRTYYPIAEVIDVATRQAISLVSEDHAEEEEVLEAVNVDSVPAELDDQETVSDFTNTTYYSHYPPYFWDSYDTDIGYYTMLHEEAYAYGETNMTVTTTMTYYTSCNEANSYSNGTLSISTSDKTEISFSETYTGWYSNTALEDSTTYTHRTLIERDASETYETTHTTASRSDYSTMSISQSATALKIIIEDI